MPNKKCDDCITKGLSWGKIMMIVGSVFTFSALQAVDMYKNSVSRDLTKANKNIITQIGKSLNETNRQLENKGIISDPLFVLFSDSLEVKYLFVDNDIEPEEDEKRLSNTKVSFEGECFEHKIIEGMR